MNILTFFVTFPSGEGLGFNTNIFETNILNLAVVLGVVISFIGDALRSLLNNRKQIIVKNLQEADERANEAQEKLTQARIQFEFAQKKAGEIKEQGILTAEQEKTEAIRQADQDALRLEELKQETLLFQQQKAVSEISQQVITLALKQVREKLNNRLDANFHASVNNFNIVLFTNYKAKP